MILSAVSGSSVALAPSSDHISLSASCACRSSNPVAKPSGSIQQICIPQSFTRHMLPCSKEEEGCSPADTAHLFFGGIGWRLLSDGGGDSAHCAKNVSPLLSDGGEDFTSQLIRFFVQ